MALFIVVSLSTVFSLILISMLIGIGPFDGKLVFDKIDLGYNDIHTRYITVNNKYVKPLFERIEQVLVQYCIDNKYPLNYYLNGIISNKVIDGITESYDCAGKVVYTIKPYVPEYIEVNEIMIAKSKSTWTTLAHEIGHVINYTIGGSEYNTEDNADKNGGLFILNHVDFTPLEKYAIMFYLHIYHRLRERKWESYSKDEQKSMIKEYVEWNKSIST